MIENVSVIIPAHNEGTRIGGIIQEALIQAPEVPISLRRIDKPRGIAWHHGIQIYLVLKMLHRLSALFVIPAWGVIQTAWGRSPHLY